MSRLAIARSELDERGSADHATGTRPSVVVAALGVLGWAIVLVTGRAWAQWLADDGVKIVLFTPPVLGGERSSVPASIVLPIVVGVVAVVVLPRLVERATWAWTVAGSTLAALAWWVSLAVVDGTRGLTRGLYWEADYADAVSAVTSAPAGFLDSYVTRLPDYPIALRGHPPGFALLFGVLDALGLSGPGWAALVVVLGGASAVVAVLVTVRLVAGEAVARRAAPFVALAPFGLWVVTSTDALTMGTAAWTVALIAFAGTRGRRTGDALAVIAGLLASFTAIQSYGLVLMALPVLVIACWQRRARPMLIAGATAAVVTCAFALFGFWWFDGLFATVHEYRTLDLDRPYLPFLLINLAAWGLALGPATAAGLASLRHRRLWVVVGGGVLAASAAWISGLSSGEVERIWLPFTVWVLPAGAALWSSARSARAWLSLQVATAITITALIGTNW